MNFVQKVYYNDKPLVLTVDSEAYIAEHPAAEHYTFFSGATLRSFSQAIALLDRPGSPGAIIEDASGASLLTQLEAMYRPVPAAGGLTFNEHNDILMIFRRGKWDLPKGKIDAGEKTDECALREVSEETGLQSLELGGKLCDTYHIYMQDGEHLLKHTAWYIMHGTSADKLKPQHAEDILEAKWVAQKDLAPLANKSYEAIKDVLRAADLHW
jgi:8-oxo-dGTP pyrophosphatase MutT (NUDIX family)